MRNAPTQPMRLLIVDDDSSDRLLASRALSGGIRDIVIDETDSLEGVRQLIHKHNYDVIVADYLFHGSSGLEVIDLAKELQIDTPIIFLTGTGTEEVAIEAMKRGVADYVIKSNEHIKRLPATVKHVLQRKSQETLQRHTEKMEALGQFASGVAHDINNLLTAIFGHVALARSMLNEEQPARRSLDSIERAAQHAGTITKALLTIGKKGGTAKKPVSLVQLVNDTSTVLRRMLPNQVAIQVDTSMGSGLWVYGDEGQLEQAILNLALNARDAMPDGGEISISISSSRESDSNFIDDDPEVQQYGWISIRDTGAGISPDLHQRIFEPFFTTKNRGIGTGLGLAIVHGIIAAHGGRLTIESEVGSGSTMSIVLPLIDNSPDLDSDPAGQAKPPRGNGERVLLVEDNEQVRGLMVTALKNNGYDVVAAKNGAEFLKQVAENKSGLKYLIVNVGLPDTDGAECLRALRRDNNQIPALLITGGSEVEFSDLLEKGTAVLHKPFGIDELVRTVAGGISGPAAA